MLTDAEAKKITESFPTVRGPIQVKWIRELLEDRAGRVRLENVVRGIAFRARQARLVEKRDSITIRELEHWIEDEATLSGVGWVLDPPGV